MTDQETNKPDKTPSKILPKKEFNLSMGFGFALQFAFMIIVPLVVFGSLGKWLSSKQGNPIFLYAGLLLALISSIIWFYIKISHLYKDLID